MAYSESSVSRSACMSPSCSEPFEEPAATDGGEPTAGATTTTVPDQTTTSVTTPTTHTTELPTGGTGNREELIRQAQEAYTSALEAQKQGDWTEYGRQIDQLGRLLEQLDRLQQETLPTHRFQHRIRTATLLIQCWVAARRRVGQDRDPRRIAECRPLKYPPRTTSPPMSLPASRGLPSPLGSASR